MELIPVIDIMSGVAVHAKEGRREHYRPLQSVLCSTAEPNSVMRGLLRLHPFKRIYVADLDALMDKGSQADLLLDLLRTFPEVEFWIDQGLPRHDKIPSFPSENNARMVVGSESLSEESVPLLASLRSGFVLSLDFLDERLLGAKQLLDSPELWPESVILMSLSHVGSTTGPDFDRLEVFSRKHSHRRFIAAGGIRNEQDLRRLKAMGAAGVLIASALHSGIVDSRMIERSARDSEWGS
ncbi:HisA/HisF-related TIM barrel protein [Methylocaldum sp.]|uniref:HisA/HisF-related TIM barrel protein n=1 Tax=Methylocaldum sp. TaxID=1969727 RepID=UPI002D48D377|nr:HisA/HisF-related TIM barrel protein [Methylocaldum sp.]HYE35993.1 HisA/HisF-related TIM barrel protein [Methylocaldum sp.]